MGRIPAFFYTQRAKATKYLNVISERYSDIDKILEIADNATGFFKNLTIQQAFEALFESEVIMKTGGTYLYGRYYEFQKAHSDDLIDRVYALASRSIMKDQMNRSVYINDIYGISVKELLEFDYATYIDFEERVNALEKRHYEELKERTEQLKHGDDH